MFSKPALIAVIVLTALYNILPIDTTAYNLVWGLNVIAIAVFFGVHHAIKWVFIGCVLGAVLGNKKG